MDNERTRQLIAAAKVLGLSDARLAAMRVEAEALASSEAISGYAKQLTAYAVSRGSVAMHTANCLYGPKAVVLAICEDRLRVGEDGLLWPCGDKGCEEHD